jgi:4-hydroxybenzoate polyprenyltransferase
MSDLPAADLRDEASKRTSLRTWAKALRLHQWVKNILMFFPLVLAHRYGEPLAFLKVAAGFVVVGMVASATYVFNDLNDLAADRAHQTKRNRPIASGKISARAAATVAIVLLLVGLAAAFALSVAFGALLLVYVLLTSSYSLWLKRLALVDVAVLGTLFTLRIFMGGAVVGIDLTIWFIVFSAFLFFSLSLAKRHTEVVRAFERGETGWIRGRGYKGSDAPLILALGVGSSVAASILLFLYVVNDAYPYGHYHRPDWLLAIAFLLLLWSARIWLKSHRGELDDDPIVFAFRDPASWGVVAAAAVCFLVAIGPPP